MFELSSQNRNLFPLVPLKARPARNAEYCGTSRELVRLGIIQISPSIFIGHIKRNRSSFLESCIGSIFGIKMILANLPSDKLAILGYFNAFQIRFICFHSVRDGKLYHLHFISSLNIVYRFVYSA